MLNELKNFDATRMAIDEMISLRAYSRILLSEYENQNVVVPEWIEAQSKNLDRQIAAKNADRLESRRRELKARIDALKTPTQKKSELERELAQLDKQLA